MTSTAVAFNLATYSDVTPATIEKRINFGLLKCKNPGIIRRASEFIYLVLELGANLRIKPFEIHLTNPLLTPSSSKICLIIDDGPGSQLNKQIAKKFIKDQLIPITKVIRISKLRTEYKPGSSLRSLSDSYDLFLIDKRVRNGLINIYRNYFSKMMKFMVQVDLTVRNWGEQVEKACSTAILRIKSWGWCSLKVGKLAMGKEEIVKNVNEGIEGLVNMMPGNWGGVKTLELNFGNSVFVLLYRDPNLTIKIENIEEDSNVGKKRKNGITVNGVEEDVGDKVSKEKQAISVKPSKKIRKTMDEESINAFITEVGKKLQLHKEKVEEDVGDKVSKEEQAISVKPSNKIRKTMDEESINTFITEVRKKLQLHNTL